MQDLDMRKLHRHPPLTHYSSECLDHDRLG
jgi:hypothetical protein